MDTTSNDDTIATFMAFTGADDVMAQQFLKTANNDLEMAASLFFAAQGGPAPGKDDEEDISMPPAPAPAKDENDADEMNSPPLPSGLVSFDLGKDPKMQEQLPPKKRKLHLHDVIPNTPKRRLRPRARPTTRLFSAIRMTRIL